MRTEKPVRNSTYGLKAKRRLLTILSFILFAIIGCVMYLIIDKKRQNIYIANLEKSFAVLPLYNESPADSNNYFINGIMDEVVNNLQKISDFRVLSSNSADQYVLPNRLAMAEIAKNLEVNYLIEGSGRKEGSKLILRLQLVREIGKETRLWRKTYEKEILEPTDVINIQSQIVHAIAKTFKVKIEAEEILNLEKTPTENLDAYDSYLQGKEVLRKYNSKNNQKDLKRAGELFGKALKYDSTYSVAYAGLAEVCRNRHISEHTSLQSLDSVLILTTNALRHDDKLAEAYLSRAIYYFENGLSEKSLRDLNKTLNLNPSSWEAYLYKSKVYSEDIYSLDFVRAMENIKKAANLNHGRELPSLYRSMGYIYSACAGFPEQADQCFLEALMIDGDSTSYLNALSLMEMNVGNYKKAIESANRSFKRDSNNTDAIGNLGHSYEFIGQNDKSLKYEMRYAGRLKDQVESQLGNMHRIGYAYQMNGKKKEGDFWFNEQIKYCEESFKKGRAYYSSFGAIYDLAAVSAFTDEKAKAFENLRLFGKIKVCPLWLVTLLKNDPLFSKIRTEQEFQKILKETESKYLRERDRFKKWQQEQGFL